ncbi:MAG: transglycosylase family protein [Acidobacteria bacterium]|nr:transglycosylase family protein [Acidobacteriota bacterium]
MRRILLTLAVALFSVAAPAAPERAGAAPIKAPHPPRAPHPSARALALARVQLHRHRLEIEARTSLHPIASQFHLTLEQLVAKWQRVAICEVNGNWSMKGPRYSGIGFSNATWVQYGGRHFAPTAGDATPVQQVAIGMRITRTWIPDQYGCSPVGW